MKYSILGLEFEKNEDDWFRQMIKDLNIDQIISGIAHYGIGYDIKSLFKIFPVEEKTVDFRKSVTKDFMSSDVQQFFYAFCQNIRKAKVLEKKVNFCATTLQGNKFHCDALSIYFDAVKNLYEQLTKQNNLSSSLNKLIDFLTYITSTKEYKEACEKTSKVKAFFDDYKFHLNLQSDKAIIVDPSETSQKYEKAFNFLVGKSTSGEYESGFDNDAMSKIELLILGNLKKVAPHIIDEINKLSKFKMNEDVLLMEEQVPFYLSFFRYIEDFQKQGYDFCIPSSSSTLTITGGYDLAMANSFLSEDKKVIPNDFSLNQDENFAVVTGPNGGGKTTYARMIGIVIFLSRMGLMVPASSANVPHYHRTLTHFCVEESNDSGRGKLLDELKRLEPMFELDIKNQFVIINELFTTAATYDATVMGKKIMDKFIADGNRGIYVTHIQKLAASENGIVSMIATLQDDHKTRAFKIIREKASETEYENSMIEKHNLTYDKLKEVLANEH